MSLKPFFCCPIKFPTCLPPLLQVTFYPFCFLCRTEQDAPIGRFIDLQKIQTFLLYLANMERLLNRPTLTVPNSNHPFPCEITINSPWICWFLKLLLDIFTPKDTSLCSKATKYYLNQKYQMWEDSMRECVPGGWARLVFFFVFFRVSVFYIQ